MSYLLYPPWVSQLCTMKTLQVPDMVFFSFLSFPLPFPPLFHHPSFFFGSAPTFSFTSGSLSLPIMPSPEWTLASSQELFALIGSPPPSAREPSALLHPTRHLQLTTIAGGTSPLSGTTGWSPGRFLREQCLRERRATERAGPHIQM